MIKIKYFLNYLSRAFRYEQKGLKKPLEFGYEAMTVSPINVNNRLCRKKIMRKLFSFFLFKYSEIPIHHIIVLKLSS